MNQITDKQMRKVYRGLDATNYHVSSAAFSSWGAKHRIAILHNPAKNYAVAVRTDDGLIDMSEEDEARSETYNSQLLEDHDCHADAGEDGCEHPVHGEAV